MKVASKLIVFEITILRKVTWTQKDKQSVSSALCETAQKMFSLRIVGSLEVLFVLSLTFFQNKEVPLLMCVSSALL